MTAMTLPTPDEMRERLVPWLERYRVAGASVAWLRDGEVQAAAAGVINMGTGVETTADTLFQIGSITKTYTTTLIMQLVDEGRINLDAPVTDYLPDARFGDAASAPAITIRHLLTHTSGVDGDFFDDFGRGDDCVQKYVDACAALPQVFAPGAMHSYCNAGFVVLGRVIEVVTGMGWDGALRERLLKPLGVTHTVTLPEQALLHRTAAGHIFDEQLSLRLTPGWTLPRSAGPAGATPCSTVSDLLAFGKMHMDGGLARDGARILSEDSVRAMQQSQHIMPAVPGGNPAHWGLGWMLFDWGGAAGTPRRVIGHDGGTIGQISSSASCPIPGSASPCSPTRPRPVRCSPPASCAGCSRKARASTCRKTRNHPKPRSPSIPRATPACTSASASAPRSPSMMDASRRRLRSRARSPPSARRPPPSTSSR